jgi:hypothetical protein
MRIYQQSWRLAVGVSVAIAVVSSITAASFGANADLSGWVGTNNTTGGNSYTVTGTSSAGGTFFDRPAAVSSLADTTILDPSNAPLLVKWNSEVSMSGTITFAVNAPVDPTLFIGWYNSALPNQRLGFGFADQVGQNNTYLRVMTQSTSTGTSIASQGIFGNGSPATVWNAPSTLPSGTYPFTFNYDGDGHMTGTFGVDGSNVPIPWARNWAFPLATGNNQDLDTFGFQQTTAAGGSATLTLNVTSLSYTGQTDAGGGGGVPGDYNHNGTVDAADYALWRKGDLAADGTGPGGTPDGTVNALDYTFWRSRFGNTSGSGSSLSNGSAVPEPATLTLAILSVGMLLVSRNRAAAK